MLSLGPIIFGLILGIIIGSQIKLNVSDAEFALTSFVVILIAGIIVAWQLGNFPFYADSFLQVVWRQWRQRHEKESSKNQCR